MNSTNETVVSHRFKSGDQVFVKTANGGIKCGIAYVTAIIERGNVGVSYMYVASCVQHYKIAQTLSHLLDLYG